jgi:hypothetical protein
LFATERLSPSARERLPNTEASSRQRLTWTYDAPRLGRVPGTWNRKYEDLPVRPRRPALLLNTALRAVVPCPVERIEEFVRKHTPPTDAGKTAEPTGQLPSASGADLRVGQDYNARCQGSILDSLPPKSTLHRQVGNDGYLQIRRPGVEHVSATWGYCKNNAGHPLLRVFSDKFAPFEPGGVYDRFGVYARVVHNRDFTAAARALAKEGYGCRTARSKDSAPKYLASDKRIAADNYGRQPGQPSGLGDCFRLDRFSLTCSGVPIARPPSVRCVSG